MFRKVRVNLNDVAIAAPCRVNWKDMKGTDKVRLCSMCNLNVYNISEMTRKEAEDMITSHHGSRFCLKLFRRSDGTILTKDCSIGRRILDRANRTLKILIASFVGMLNISPTFAQQIPETIERYGFGVNVKQEFGPPAPTRLINARIGEQGGPSSHADTSALALFNRARELEQFKNPIVALLFYARTVDALRLDSSKWDPKFVKLVGTKYARLLHKTGDRQTAKSIKSEFARK